MLEKIGEKDIVVRNYTDNFQIKEFIQEEAVPKAFPDIPVTSLNLGFHGLISEYIAQGIEDATATAALMHNESFITRAVLPESIYSEAALFDGIGYNFATPSKCSFAIQLSLKDVINFSEDVQNTNVKRYILDKDTQVILGNNIYKLDYDIFIDHTFVDGRRVFNIYYDMSETNSISKVTNRYIKHQVSSIDWLVLFLDLMEFDRKTETESITDNLLTANSDIEIMWDRQIAGLDLVYISPTGQRLPMKLKRQFTRPDVDPFVWYRFIDDYTIALSFANNEGYWVPEFNSKVEYTVYTTMGKAGDFNKYNRRTGVPVSKTGERFSYNAETNMIGICYSGSTGGEDKGNVEDLRDEVILQYNTAGVLINEYDLTRWFEKYGKRHNSKARFFKRRDDPSGRLFSQFIAIKDGTYVYPTNTLSIVVNQDEFDYVNSDGSGTNKEFIIKPGHLWEYYDTDDEISRTKVRMIKGSEGMAMITDDAIPTVNENRSFMFVNPFCIKIYKEPTISANYNYLIDHTSWPEDVPINTNSVYQFQLAQFSIERTLSSKYRNMYHIEVICVPVITTDAEVKYIEGVGDDYPVANNNMRVILITTSKKYGETGYIEMTPTEKRTAESVLYEANIAVYDNIESDMTLEVDLERTPDMHSLILNGDNAERVFIDTEETSFHIAVMMRETDNPNANGIYNNPTYDGYIMANRFRNDHRDLVLYKPLSMMKSMITFTGENDNYTVEASLMPFIRYDIPLDEEKMLYFIQAFYDQYSAMEPALSKLDGDLDFKLYNTYGRSNNYYIGPMDNDTVIKNSTILLDNVYVKVKLVISVYDRSMYTQTVNRVIDELIETFDGLNNSDNTDIHVSEIMYNIKANNPNVRYIRFLGFNAYDANKQSIFIKNTNLNTISQEDLMLHVPEMIRLDSNSIEITEEI